MRCCYGESESFSGKHTLLELTPCCLAHAGTHAKGRSSHAPCLQMIRIGQAMGRSGNMGADHPTHWGQTTKRHLEVLQPVGDTGEVQPDERRPRRRVGSQKARSTRLNLHFGKGKALETPVIGKGPRYLLGLSGFNSTQLIKATLTDLRLAMTDTVRYAVCSLSAPWISSYDKKRTGGQSGGLKVL
ncbi:unnamed protein product [Calypogeia fissa]